MRAGIYGRLSVVRPQGNGHPQVETSTDRQVADCFAWVQRQDGEVVATYRDEGISGYSGMVRPDFERLLGDLGDGTIDTVVCWKLDRLARNHRDFQRLWEACETSKARLVSLHELFDTATPAGEFTVRLLIGMAKMESDNISLRVKRALRALRENGRLHTGGGRPFGHTWQGELVRGEAAVIRWAALRVLAGHGLAAICADMRARGVTGSRGRPIGRRNLKRILICGRTAGLVEHQGELLGPGGWAPILQRATWEQVRVILTSPGRGLDPRPLRYLLVGFLVCGRCGAKLVSRPTHGRRTYVCAATGVVHLAVAADAVEKQVGEIVLRSVDQEGLTKILAARASASDARMLAGQLEELDGRLRQLGDDYGDGTLDKPTYLRQKSRLEERRAGVQQRLDRLVARRQLVGIPRGPGALRVWWAKPSTTVMQRRVLLSLLLDHVVVGPAARASRTLDPGRLSPPDYGPVWRI